MTRLCNGPPNSTSRSSLVASSGQKIGEVALKEGEGGRRLRDHELDLRRAAAD